MTYQVTEPHPSAAPSTRIHTGRGGAGNTYRTPSHSSTTSTSRKASLSHIPTHTTTSSSTCSTNKFSSGRGGAGNIKPLSQAALYDLDEELKLQTTRDERVNSWHVGRGGAGNYAAKRSGQDEQEERKSRKMSNESASSDGSARSGFFGRLRI